MFIPTSKTYRSPAYLAWIRKQPCMVCGGHGSVAAHLTFGLGGMGIKAPDTHAVPMCHSCHHYAHSGSRDPLRTGDPKMEVIRLLTRYLQEMKNEG